jgi:acetyltransferase
MALVAEIEDAAGQPAIIAAARLIKVYGTGEAEFAIIVTDEYQGMGLGTELLQKLVDIGRQEGLDRIYGNILRANIDMRRVAERLGFEVEGQPQDGAMRMKIEL